MASVQNSTQLIFEARYHEDPSGDFRVEEYRAYFVGRDGHFNGFEPIVCADDAAAIEKAKRLVNRHGIELWNGPRLVVRLDQGTIRSA